MDLNKISPGDYKAKTTKSSMMIMMMNLFWEMEVFGFSLSDLKKNI